MRQRCALRAVVFVTGPEDGRMDGQACLYRQRRSQGSSGTENGMITSLSNSRVKNVTALNRKAKERKSQGKYVVEGVKMFLEAPEAEIEEIYVAESFEEGCRKNPHGNPNFASCLKKLDGLSFESVSDEVFAKMSDTEAPQGILCVMKRRE